MTPGFSCVVPIPDARAISHVARSRSRHAYRRLPLPDKPVVVIIYVLARYVNILFTAVCCAQR